MAEQIKNIDVEQKKEEKENEQKAKATRTSSFANVPIAFKILGFLFLFLKYNEITQRKGNISEMWIYIIMVGVVWYFLGMDYIQQRTGILSPKEAYDCLRSEVNIMKKDGRIKYNQKIVINPVQNLATHEAIPTYYIFSVILYSNDAGVMKYKAMVSAKGETMGFVYMVKSTTEERGDGAEHTKSIVPKFVKDADKYPALKGLFGLGDRR